ncbi:hypothetical protein HU200_021297 [Digitaria exilis]|uniref:Uncharacterized protein n=1 Tax=Digitaria exilis TaxID=1010633 RepID=A0A835KCW2_9POAL|nr:hypothetical protein HU200_021297 [Digitaria exilis]
MESEASSRGADADGRPPPQPGPPSPPPQKDRVSFSSSSRLRPSCWGRIRMIRRPSRSMSRAGSGAAPDATRSVISSRGLCGGGGDRGRCGCGGRADVAAGATARSLLQRNDFYCDECNTHR